MTKILIVGAGLAGCEAAYYLAKKNYSIVLVEGKKIKPTPAQSLEYFAELVCTNSLKSIKQTSAHGLLKYDMEQFGSLVLQVGNQEGIRVPAGDSLAVDRMLFSKKIQEVLQSTEKIQIVEELVSNPLEFAQKHSCTHIILATGPLTHGGLDQWIQENICTQNLYFYDSIAPIVDADSLNYEKLYFKDRHLEVDEKIKADYLNAPFTKEEYLKFVEELAKAEFIPPKNFEKEIFFENCLPVDVMAKRGKDTLRYSCMKPIGLENPIDNKRPYAVVQLRKENLLGDAFNLVGFQSRLTYADQKRIFCMIPGLENAEFFHYGSVHRNTFIHAKEVLDWDFSSKKFPTIYFAGQIVGVEGYTESAMCGLYVAYMLDKKLNSLSSLKTIDKWPLEIATGALVNHIMTAQRPSPTSINFGIMPTPEFIPKGVDKKLFKKEFIVHQAKEAWKNFSSLQNRIDLNLNGVCTYDSATI